MTQLKLSKAISDKLISKMSARKLATLSPSRKLLLDKISGVRRPQVIPGLRVPPAPDKNQAPEIPEAPSNNPFDSLPYPSPGDRIESDHFKMLSQSLDFIQRATLLASALFGERFAIARAVLAAEGYEIASVHTVYGQELENPATDALDERVVLQVSPVELGESAVTIVLSEEVEQRIVMPNLIGMTYGAASQAVKGALGSVNMGTSVTPNLIGQTLGSVTK